MGMFHWEWWKDFQKTYLFFYKKKKKKTVKVLAKIAIINFFSTWEINHNV